MRGGNRPFAGFLAKFNIERLTEEARRHAGDLAFQTQGSGPSCVSFHALVPLVVRSATSWKRGQTIDHGKERKMTFTTFVTNVRAGAAREQRAPTCYTTRVAAGRSCVSRRAWRGGPARLPGDQGKEGRLMSRAERYDAMLKAQGKPHASGEDLAADRRNPAYLTMRRRRAFSRRRRARSLAGGARR